MFRFLRYLEFEGHEEVNAVLSYSVLFYSYPNASHQSIFPPIAVRCYLMEDNCNIIQLNWTLMNIVDQFGLFLNCLFLFQTSSLFMHTCTSSLFMHTSYCMNYRGYNILLSGRAGPPSMFFSFLIVQANFLFSLIQKKFIVNYLAAGKK